MNRIARIALAATAISLATLLSGCENFDPTALFDAEIFNTKKKLPGERKPVFPEGTPGVSQGVPPELVKGYQPPAPEPVAAPEPPKPEKPKPKPHVAAKPKPAAQPAPAQAAAAPAPAQGQAQWPAPPAQQQQQQSSAGANWPSAPQPGGGVAWPAPPPTTR